MDELRPVKAERLSSGRGAGAQNTRSLLPVRPLPPIPFLLGVRGTTFSASQETRLHAASPVLRVCTRVCSPNTWLVPPTPALLSAPRAPQFPSPGF